MNTIKISIRTISEKNGWMNITANDDKELSCLIKDGKNPLCAAILTKAANGEEVTIPGKIVEKDGKSYIWDVQEGKAGGKSFAPADKPFQAALAAAQAVGSVFAGKASELTPKAFDVIFQHIHGEIMKKSNTNKPV